VGNDEPTDAEAATGGMDTTVAVSAVRGGSFNRASSALAHSSCGSRSNGSDSLSVQLASSPDSLRVQPVSASPA
jgi:hypothetical protein